MMLIREESRMKHDHIPSEVIEKDIADTQYEIDQMRREADGFRMVGDRMSLFRADAREDGIREREVFIVKLKAILAAREVNP